MSVMSKKHYAAVARAVKRRYEQALVNPNDVESVAAICALLSLAVDLSRMFADDNPSFDKTRFLLACGINTGAAKRGEVTATVNRATKKSGLIECWKHGGKETCATCDCSNSQRSVK